MGIFALPFLITFATAFREPVKHVGPSPEWPLTVLIIDEAHTYFREYRGSDATTKRLAALTAENRLQPRRCPPRRPRQAPKRTGTAVRRRRGLLMTTPRPASSRVGANGDGTVYQRKDSRWEAAGYVLAPGNTRKRIRVYGTTRKEALAKLTEKIAASNRGVPAPSAQGSLSA